MQLRQLQYFVAVAEQLNFRKAAEMLYVTQPLLSKQISELEDEVGYPLFIRNTRSVSLTPAGKVMLSEANKLIRQADSLLFSVQNAAKYGNDYGVLHIGYEESYSQAMLAQILNQMRENYPGVEVNIQRFTSNEIKKALQDEIIDVGFIFLPDKHLGTNMDCQILACDTLCLATSDRLLPEDASLDQFVELANEKPICLLEKNAKGMNLISDLCQQMNVYTNYVFAETTQDMLLYAESGYGISVLPESFLNYHRQSPITAYKMKSVDAELCMAAIWVRDTSCQPRNKLLEICSSRHVDCNLCSKTWCCQNHVGK
ncbi:LysR family transcriptional regulator [Eubacterium ramulus]